MQQDPAFGIRQIVDIALRALSLGINDTTAGNVAIMSQMRGALQIITTLTTSPSRLQALREQVQWIDELAGRTIESPHDRTLVESRLARVRETL